MLVLKRRDCQGLDPRVVAQMVEPRFNERDTLVIVDTVDTLDGPEVSQTPSVPLCTPADCQSAAPSIVDHRGVTFVTLQRQAEERGMSLSELPDGYQLADNEYGTVTRQHLADLIPFIKSPRSIMFT